MTSPQPASVARPGPPPTNTLALVGFIAVFFVSIVGIVLGVMAQRQIAVTGEGGAGLAKAAFRLGIIFTAFQVLVFVVWLALFGSFILHNTR